MNFFQEIKQQDEKMTVMVNGGWCSLLFFPNLRFLPVCFDAGNQGTCSIVTRGTRQPSRQRGVKEEWVFELGVFEAKDGGPGNVSVEHEEERNVVRSGSDTV